MQNLRLGVSTFIVLGSSLAGAAHAIPSNRVDPVEVTVSYADLNIGNEQGAKMLYARLSHASARACELRSYPELGSLERYTAAKRCYADLMDQMVAKIDSPELTKIHGS